MKPARAIPRALAAGALSLLLATAGCGGDSGTPAPRPGGSAGEEAGTPVRGDWLRRCETADPQTLNFVRCQDRLGKMLGHLISDTLVHYDSRLRIVGRLAESWEFSPDHRVLTFRMREGARWHDGEPVTARDAAYTIEKILDPASQAVSRYPLFESVERVEAPDDRTLRVLYREPHAAALDAWTDAILIPRHLYEKEADFLNNSQSRAPTGCGPFRLLHWRQAEELVLEANDDYWDGRPHLDRIVIRIVPQDSTRMQALRLGQIDELSMTPQQFVVEATGPEIEERLRKITGTVLFLFYIGWNGDGSNPFFGDIRVRQAMTYALDRPGLIETLWYGRAVPAASPIPPGSWAHDPSVLPYPYDPQRAMALLEEAGWTDRDGDGVREKGGRPFAFSLLYPAVGQTNDQIAAFFQENLRRVGVRMELTKMEFRTFLERTRARRFEASMSGMQLDPDPDLYDLFHSSQAATGSNRTSYSNPEADRLLEAGRREFDRERRREIYTRLQRNLGEDQPYTFIFHPAYNLAIDRRFRGVELSPVGIYLFWPGVSRWWVPADEQLFPAAGGRAAR